MTRQFTGQEIIEIALRIEKNGEQLYRTLSEQAEYMNVKNAFNALANEEKTHIASFGRLRDIIGNFVPAEAYPGEYSLYLQALVEENVFAKQDIIVDLARKAVTITEALDLAILFEKESLIFLNGVRDSMEKEDMAVLQELIQQEKEHLKKLWEIKKTLSSGSKNGE